MKESYIPGPQYRAYWHCLKLHRLFVQYNLCIISESTNDYSSSNQLVKHF